MEPEKIQTSLPENAYRELKPGEEYTPVMPASSNPKEVTPYSVTMGVVMAVVFSAAAAFLGLKVGQVFEAAIPIAIIAVGMGSVLGKKNMLGQNVIIQSIGASSGVIVAGAIFTLPALYILGLDAAFWQVFLSSLFGGLLGSLFLTGHFAGDYTAAEGTLGARTETALRQNLPLRDALKRWKTTLLMLGGVQELDGIYFTGEGLIENLTVTDEALGEKNLAVLQDYCREAEPYTVLLPSACAISSQLLPEAALLFDQETWLQNAAAALSPLCREVLNAYPLLEENGDSRLFYRTDSRPTQLTGYLLYQALGQALDYFPYAKDSFSNTPLRYDCTGDLYARWSYDKVRADVVTALLPLEDSRSYTITHTAADGTVTRWNTLYPLEGTAGIDCILGGPAAIIAVTAEGSIPRSLLVLGDENALCVIPYLALHYDRITYVDVTRCSEEQLPAIAGTEYSRTLLLYGAPTLLNTALTTGLATLTQS